MVALEIGLANSDRVLNPVRVEKTPSAASFSTPKGDGLKPYKIASFT